MSAWTHVAGIIRIDDFRFDKNDILDFDDIFGKECLWKSPMEVWDEQEEHPERFLPMGSEGSLQKSIWINPEINHIASYTVSIFGDLRDHYNAEGIIEWFKEKCKLVSVRNAVISVDNSCISKSLVWVYGDD